MDAVDDFLEARDNLEKDAAQDLKKKELQMWEQWKDGGMQKKELKPLLNSLRPLINNQVNIWARQRDVPPAAIKAEFTNHAVNALQTYDPSRGAMSTHITHQLRRAQRFVTSYQNPARIPENRIYKIRTFQDGERELEEKLGRDPTQLELADKLKWSPRQVGMMSTEIRKALPTSHMASDPSSHIPSEMQEVMRLLPYELDSEEKVVFEHIHGLGGKPVMSPGDIARKYNMSAPKVSRLKKSIGEKMKKYL